MKINVLPVGQLSPDHVSAWSKLQRSDASCSSPFFRPEFSQAVAAERGGVDVAVLEQAGEPVGFLPFERSWSRVGRAVGFEINQFQGAVVRPDVAWEPREVVRAAGLRSWRFDHLAAGQGAFVPHQSVVVGSPFIDLAGGFDHYYKSRGKSAGKFISHIFQKERKAERELGDVRLEINHADRATVKRLIGWKSDQCRQRHERCAYQFDWMVRLHDRLLDHTADDFAATVFSLHMGDRPAAGLFCLRSGHVLQGSLLSYDRELAAYAPGLVILMRAAQLANSLGITRIDLGAGGDAYKQKIATGHDQVTEGAVTSSRMLNPLYQGWVRVKDRLRATRLRQPVRAVRAWMLSTRIRLGLAD